MDASIEIVNDDQVVILSDNRDVICLLGQGSTEPAGTLFTALAGASGNTKMHFGHPPASATAQHGVQVQILDASGNLLFDAMRYGKLARPVGVLSVSPIAYPGTTASATKTFASGRTYAVYVSQQPSPFIVRNVSTKLGNQYLYQYVMDEVTARISVSGATVTLTVDVVRDTNPKGIPSSVPYTSNGVAAARAIVLDVTNF